jgi:hypothetical protein
MKKKLDLIQLNKETNKEFNNKDFFKFMTEAFEEIDTQETIAQLKKERALKGQDPCGAFNDGSIDKDKRGF